MKEYKNPRLKHVNNIKTICGDISYVIGTPKTFVDMQVESIIHQCNLLLETKKDSVKEDVKFLKDNGFKSLSKALVKLDKETKKAKKRKKETYYYRITGIHDDGSLSKTPKTGSFTVTQPDPKEESKTSTPTESKEKICNCRGNGNANNVDLPCSSCGGINPMKQKIEGGKKILKMFGLRKISYYDNLKDEMLEMVFESRRAKKSITIPYFDTYITIKAEERPVVFKLDKPL